MFSYLESAGHRRHERLVRSIELDGPESAHISRLSHSPIRRRSLIPGEYYGIQSGAGTGQWSAVEDVALASGRLNLQDAARQSRAWAESATSEFARMKPELRVFISWCAGLPPDMNDWYDNRVRRPRELACHITALALGGSCPPFVNSGLRRNPEGRGGGTDDSPTLSTGAPILMPWCADEIRPLSRVRLRK